MIKPEELTQGVYKGRRPIGPGVSQTIIILVRGKAPLFQIKVFVNANDGVEELPNAIGYLANGLYPIDERLSDL